MSIQSAVRRARERFAVPTMFHGKQCNQTPVRVTLWCGCGHSTTSLTDDHEDAEVEHAKEVYRVAHDSSIHKRRSHV